jgi:hypothetical protein
MLVFCLASVNAHLLLANKAGQLILRRGRFYVSSKADRLNLTPGQATYVVIRLVEDGKLSVPEVERIAALMDAEIAELESRLARLQGALRGPTRSATKRGHHAGMASVQQARSRRVQGEYMGLIRHLGGRDRTRIKKLAAERGREAAIKEMRSLTR